MRYIPTPIANDLHFNMTKAIDRRLLSEQLLRRTLFHSSPDRRSKLRFIANQSDASAATAINGFDHDWEAGL